MMFTAALFAPNSLDVCFHHPGVLFNSFEMLFQARRFCRPLRSDRRGNPLGHDTAAGALTAAQALDEGADRGIGREAEASQHLPGQSGLMPAVQATDDQYFTSSHATRKHSFDAERQSLYLGAPSLEIERQVRTRVHSFLSEPHCPLVFCWR